MIPFFTGYAVIVWWLAGRFRRTWTGYACVAAGAAFMGLVIFGHYQLGIATQGRIYMEVLQPILYAYGLMVTSMGLFVASLPRRVEHGRRCHACGYDLEWIENGDPGVCPECGTIRPLAARASPGPAEHARERAEQQH